MPMFDTEPTSIAATTTYKKRKSYFLLTYKDVLQEDFDSGIYSIEIFHLQTGNSKQQTTNRKVNMALKPTHQWGTTKCSSNRGCRVPSVQTARRPTSKQEKQQHENKKPLNKQ
jgi:hypothetical protein